MDTLLQYAKANLDLKMCLYGKIFNAFKGTFSNDFYPRILKIIALHCIAV